MNQRQNKIKVIDSGLLTSVQDMGRYGYQKYGIIVSGAMDTVSLALANIAVGNQLDTGTLEMTLCGASLELHAGTVFALTAADMSAALADEPVPMHRPVLVTRDAVLTLHGTGKGTGARTYLAFAGGIRVPQRMGSQSTYLRAGIGGYQGRALQAGDVLCLGDAAPMADRLRGTGHRISTSMISVSWRTPMVPVRTMRPIRVTRGLEADWFTSDSLEAFFAQGTFRLTNQSDRMGYRLAGSKLCLRQPRELISEPVAFGTVQVADGQPIILMADRQTTGGYPKIAQVAQADLSRLGQKKAGDTLVFEEVTLREAEKLLRDQRAMLAEVESSVHLALGKGL